LNPWLSSCVDVENDKVALKFERERPESNERR
jgi:hypothetical protein